MALDFLGRDNHFTTTIFQAIDAIGHIRVIANVEMIIFFITFFLVVMEKETKVIYFDLKFYQ